MLSFEEIEDCFPDGACSDEATGKTLVSAQWLHDFAHSVAAREREACAKECERLRDKWMRGECGHSISDFSACAESIRLRSNAKVSGGTASAGLPGYAGDDKGE